MKGTVRYDFDPHCVLASLQSGQLDHGEVVRTLEEACHAFIAERRLRHVAQDLVQRLGKVMEGFER